MRFPIPQNEVKQASITLYLPDGKLYNPIRDSSARIEEERQKQERIVTGLPRFAITRWERPLKSFAIPKIRDD